MVRSIIIEIDNDKHFALLKGLAKDLRVTVKEIHSENKPTPCEQQAAFERFVGSWKGEETAAELEAAIYADRNCHSQI